MQTSRTDKKIENQQTDAYTSRPTPPANTPRSPELQTALPRKSRPVSALQFSKNPADALPESAKSFHLVEKVFYKGGLRFFKHNTPGSYMSELEAAAWAIYQLIASDYVPAKVNAHYDDNGIFVGVSSTALPGFVAALDEKLTEEHLKDPEIVKGNAIGTSVSLICEEEDYHTGNTDLEGRRIDLDMSFWPILGLFKEGKPIDWFYRSRDPAKFRSTARDIDNFPDIQDAAPFYWPTKPQPYLREGTRQVLSKWVAISKNAFKSTENGVYKKLNKIPEFHYYKFRTFLKFLLLSDHIIETVIKNHLRPELTHIDSSGKRRKICDIFRDHVIDRRERIREVLVAMPSFQDFLAETGEKAMKEIREEFKTHNDRITLSENRKWERNHNRNAAILINNVIDDDEVEDTYNSIFTEANNHWVDSLRVNQKL